MLMSSSRRWDPTDGGHLRVGSNKGDFGVIVHCLTVSDKSHVSWLSAVLGRRLQLFMKCDSERRFVMYVIGSFMRNSI